MLTILLKKTKWAVFLLSLLSGLLLSSCASKPQQELRISSLLWPGYEPLVLAEKLGYFQQAPIKILDYLSNTDAIAAFKNHSLEAGAFTLDETLQLLSDGVDIQIVLIMDTSDGGDVILANPDIQSISDLKGHPVAVESSAVGAYVLQRALELNGLTLDDIDVISTHAMEQQQAFKNGEVVAAVSFDPYRTELIQDGKHPIFNSKSIPNEIIDVLVVRTDVVENNPKVIRQLTQGWFKALAFQKENPNKAAEYALPRYKVSTEEYLKSLSGLKFTTLKENKTLLDRQASPLYELEPKLKKTLSSLGLVNQVDHDTLLLSKHLNGRFLPNE